MPKGDFFGCLSLQAFEPVSLAVHEFCALGVPTRVSMASCFGELEAAGAQFEEISKGILISIWRMQPAQHPYRRLPFFRPHLDLHPLRMDKAGRWVPGNAYRGFSRVIEIPAQGVRVKHESGRRFPVGSAAADNRGCREKSGQ